MQFLKIIEARSKAMDLIINFQHTEKQHLNCLLYHKKILNYTFYASKAFIITGLIASINWKRPAAFTNREIPLALFAVGLCTLTDYITSEYVWNHTKDLLLQYTGFREGIYISPDKMSKMSNLYKNKPAIDEQDEDYIQE